MSLTYLLLSVASQGPPAPQPIHPASPVNPQACPIDRLTHPIRHHHQTIHPASAWVPTQPPTHTQPLHQPTLSSSCSSIRPATPFPETSFPQPPPPPLPPACPSAPSSLKDQLLYTPQPSSLVHLLIPLSLWLATSIHDSPVGGLRVLYRRLELGAEHGGGGRAAVSVEGASGAVREWAGGDTWEQSRGWSKGGFGRIRAWGSGDEDLGSVWGVEEQESRRKGAGGLDRGWRVHV